MATLQEQYNSIKSGSGNKDQFLKHARSLFPEYFNQYTDFNTATNVLKSKQIISEAIGGVVAKKFDIYDWKKILAEEVKAEEKETSKEVTDKQAHAYDNLDMKNADNVNFNEIMKGFYAEMRDEKNTGKTGDEIKAMVVKNLAKDPLFYTKDGMFGVKGLGYTDEAPGLGKNTQPTSKNASILGGRDEVNSDSDIVKNSLVGSAKKNVQDSLGDKEAETSMPKKVKEMPDKGVTGVEKKMKLQEAKYRVYTDDAHMDSKDVWQNEDGTWPEVSDKWNLTGEYEYDEVDKVNENLVEQKLRSLIRNVIKEALTEESKYEDAMPKYRLGALKKLLDASIKDGSSQDVITHLQNAIQSLEKQSSVNEISPELFKKATDIARNRGQDQRISSMGETFFNKFKGKPLMGGEIINIRYGKPQQAGYEEVTVKIEYKSDISSEAKFRYVGYDVKTDQWDVDKEITRADARILSLIAKHINPDTQYKLGGEGFKIKGY
jgi:hypothetical protein